MFGWYFGATLIYQPYRFGNWRPYFMSIFYDSRKASASALILLFAAGLLVGGFVSFYIKKLPL